MTKCPGGTNDSSAVPLGDGSGELAALRECVDAYVFSAGNVRKPLVQPHPVEKMGVFAREQDAGGAPCGQTQTGLRRDGLYPAKGETALDGLHGVIRCAGGISKIAQRAAHKN